jgi:hypothetical protein
MKAHGGGGEEIHLLSFLTSGLDGSHLSFTFAGRFTSVDSAPGTRKIWGSVGPRDRKIPWFSNPCSKRVGMKQRRPTRKNISGQLYEKLRDWPGGLSVVNVKFLTYICTTPTDIEPRTFQYLLRVTYTLVISGSESGYSSDAQIMKAMKTRMMNWIWYPMNM